MDFFILRHDVSNSQLWLYNLFLIVYFLYLFCKYRNKDSVARFTIFLFTVGIFADLGRLLGVSGNMLSHLYLVISMTWGFILLNRNGFKSKPIILLSFLIYALYFVFISVVIHGDNLGLVTSQIFKYAIPVISFFIFDSYVKIKNINAFNLINKVIYDIIFAQIIFCVIKLLILQSTLEGLVGSLTGLTGGGAGTSFPLLALLWLAFVSKMKFSRKFVFFTFGLLFIGFMTGKRAIWLLFPIEFAILYLYYRVDNHSKLIKYLFPSLFALAFFMYFGLRLSPTLNPDNKVWGRFDIEYAYNYAISYSSSGSIKDGQGFVEEGDGRLGSALLFWNRLTRVAEYDQQILFGVGNETVKYYNSDNYFDKEANMGVSYRGGITGIVFMFFISGLIGVFLFFNYFVRIIFKNKNTKYPLIIFGVMLFDFIFYNGQIINNVSMNNFLFILVVITTLHKATIKQL